jgi:hypothetical protein
MSRATFTLLSTCTFVAMAAVLTTIALNRSPKMTNSEPTASRELIPTSTPWADLQTAVALQLTHQPTATETQRPETTRQATKTPVLLCTDESLPTKTVCDQWSPTPTKTPQPTQMPDPTTGPCRKTPIAGASPPRYCISQGE